MSSRPPGWSVTNVTPVPANSASIGGNLNQRINNLVVGCISVIRCTHLHGEITVNGVDLTQTISNLSNKIYELSGFANGNQQGVLSTLSYQLYNLSNRTNRMSEIHWETISNLSYRSDTEFEWIHSFLSSASNQIFIGNSGHNNKIYIGYPGDEVYLSGSVTIIETTNLNISDSLITLNQGGILPQNVGIQVEILSDSNAAYMKMNANGEWIIKNYNGPEFNLSEISNRISTCCDES